MVPEYAEKVTGHGKEEDLGREGLLTESLDIFKIQQECAHKNGLKTTIQMTYASLFNEEAVALAKEHHEKYGDEIGLSLLGLPCKEFREKYHTEDFCIWMFSDEDKKRIVDDVFSLFYSKFGFYPTSTGSYFLDSFTINYIKESILWLNVQWQLAGKKVPKLITHVTILGTHLWMAALGILGYLPKSTHTALQ
jgi:hypothetical protein